MQRDEVIAGKKEKYQKQMDLILAELEKNVSMNEDYLSLDVLNTRCIRLPKTRIGDEMRLLFKDAFMAMLKYDDIEEVSSLEDFWRG